MTLDEANAMTRDLAQRFQDGGLSGNDAFTVLLSYALAIGNDTRGPVEVGRHLFMLALKYTQDHEEAIRAGIVATVERDLGETTH